jgi:hypothetical protein
LISDDGNGNIDSNNNVESLGQFDDSLFLTQNKYKEIDTIKSIAIFFHVDGRARMAQ